MVEWVKICNAFPEWTTWLMLAQHINIYNIYEKYSDENRPHSSYVQPAIFSWSSGTTMIKVPSPPMILKHNMDTVGTHHGHRTWILHKKSEVSDMIRHDTLTILMYPCIIALHTQPLRPKKKKKLWVELPQAQNLAPLQLLLLKWNPKKWCLHCLTKKCSGIFFKKIPL